jgi:DNA topoisomerase-1
VTTLSDLPIKEQSKFMLVLHDVANPFAGDTLPIKEFALEIEVIKEKREKDTNKIIREFTENPDVRVLNGRFGPYVAVAKNNFKIPKSVDPKTLTLQDCLDLSEGKKLASDTGETPVKKAAAKKPAAKKVAKK